MKKIKSVWKSAKALPDEKHLKKLWNSKLKNLDLSLSMEDKYSKQKYAANLPLLKAGGMNERQAVKLIKKDATASLKMLKNTQKKLAKPVMDFKPIHKTDLRLAKKNASLITTHNPSWSGFLWNANSGGYWSSWNGESEEYPSVSFSVSSNRFDPKAQAYGEGWWDSDFSKIHAYLTYRITPPSWGHLHIYAFPWIHGYYSLYSNDAWYKGEYASASVKTWMDVHQNYWRPRTYNTVFSMGDDELHPEKSNRIDTQRSHFYYTNVGEGDTVTIRIGVRLYCRGKANGGRALLNFRSGAANYIYIPYLYWYLHH